MTPVLEAYDGSFGCDFVVSKVLQGPSDGLNRVSTITFPDRATRVRFFADAHYREVRAAHFDGAVAKAVVLAEFVEDPSRTCGRV
ncbi:MAG TPA: DUF1330 domain-containing protein [Candidatus Binatia bacterium]|jgi:hypothetical protein